jgi:7-carboxy-7-deazaguanine synthase
MKISEIFYSIQGETTFAGRPCAFIRLAGCDLRCSYCDTEYAQSGGEDRSIDEIMKEIEKYPARLAMVTGGEPMLQTDVHDLFRALIAGGYTVLVETGGHISLAGVDARVHKIMDLKCPSSGMDHHNDYTNIGCLTSRDELKFVIGDRRDFDWACDLIRKNRGRLRVGQILFSPVTGKVSLQYLAEWVLSCGLDVRLQLQLHKIIWPEIPRGK